MNKVKIQNCEDRAKMVSILAMAGYIAWIEEKQAGRSLLSMDYYVCWKEKESEVEKS